MDLDRDGHLDILSGSYPGELYWFRGAGRGTFQEPMQLKDRHGEVLNLGSAAAVYAFDWDADGDLDLVVGDIRGQVWWVPNESGNESLTFGEGTRLEAEGKPIRVPGGDAGPVVADWDGDGTADLIVGCGDGSVRLYRNASRGGEPVLAAHTDLIETAGGMSLEAGAPSRPGARAKVCVTDFNGDGRLDLLTGDVLMERMPAPALTAEQVAERDRLQHKIAWVQARYAPAYQRVQAAAFAVAGVETNGGFDRKVWDGLDEDQRKTYSAALREGMQKDVEFAALSRMLREAHRAMRPFRPQSNIHGHVWVWLRNGP